MIERLFRIGDDTMQVIGGRAYVKPVAFWNAASPFNIFQAGFSFVMATVRETKTGSKRSVFALNSTNSIPAFLRNGFSELLGSSTATRSVKVD